VYDRLKAFLHTEAPGTVLLTNVAFVVLILLIWRLTGQVAGGLDSDAARSANRLLALIGGLCGLIVGVAFAPFTDLEEKKFRAISSVVSAFLSGYVVSKLDRFVEGALFPITEYAWSRVGLFIAALLLVSATVFLNRLYAFRDDSVRAEATSGAPGST
jgi:hypothetical protein